MAPTKQDIPPIIVSARILKQAIQEQPQDQQKVGAAYDRLISVLTPHYYRRVPDRSDVSDPINRALLELWQRAWIANIRTSIRDQRAVIQVIDALNAAVANNGKALRDKQTEVRDEWIYKQCCAGVAYDTIVRRLAKRKRWQHISTKQGIQYAARRYAERNNLPAPPPRQGR
jgi:hypothetical protein